MRGGDWMKWIVMLLGLIPATVLGVAVEKLPRFSGIDLQGKYFESSRVETPVTVLFFTGTGCPVVRQSIPKLKEIYGKYKGDQVTFLLINTSAEDSLQTIEKEMRELRVSPVRVLVDDKQALTLGFGVDRTAEVIAIDNRESRLIYRGAIDDQLTDGGQKPKATEHYLKTALEEFFAGKPVTLARTQTHGCRITFEGGKKVSYAREVVPILQQKCLHCHSEGNIGPFQMSSHAKVKNKARMIEETIMNRQMPPWHADNQRGHYKNDMSLSIVQTQNLLTWIQQGSTKDEGEDPLVAVHAREAELNKQEWISGTPDMVVSLPERQTIPATGLLDYRHFTLKSKFTNDVWLSGITVRPGNRLVVHHIIVRAKFEGVGDDGSGKGKFMVGWAPGARIAKYPENTGRFLGKDAEFDVEIHYTTCGTEQTDLSQIGFYLRPSPPEREIIVAASYGLDFVIAPNDEDSRTFTTLPVKQETVIHTLSPHMHLRGSWMKYEALYPNGKRELLLSVPRFDFNWQTVYQLEEPKTLPAGSWLLVTGGFDNSKKNAHNPDPNKRVTWGDQSFDEMFIGFLEVVVNKERTPPRTTTVSSP